MERRAFLALLASAPIAALAPLPKILEQRNMTIAMDWSKIPAPSGLKFHPNAFALAMEPLDVEHIGVIYGRGFFRRGNELWEYRAPLSTPRLPRQRFDPARLPN